MGYRDNIMECYSKFREVIAGVKKTKCGAKLFQASI
jgi:hypothetical protein